jgi:hypothetical protein
MEGVESRFSTNFNIKADGIVFLWNGKTVHGLAVILVFSKWMLGKIIHYLPKHSLKFGFGSKKFIETITYAGVIIWRCLQS